MQGKMNARPGSHAYLMFGPRLIAHWITKFRPKGFPIQVFVKIKIMHPDIKLIAQKVQKVPFANYIFPL